MTDTALARSPEGDIAIRLMRDELTDFQLMARWLTDERVLEFYGGRDDPVSLDRVQEKYGPRVQALERVVPCIIEWRGGAVGYVQFYPVIEADGLGVEFEDIAYGIDIFIGEPELWNRGIGTSAVRALMQYLFEELGASRLFIDPRAANARASGCYEKAGFRKVRILRDHELHEGQRWDCWVMTCEGPSLWDRELAADVAVGRPESIRR